MHPVRGGSTMWALGNCGKSDFATAKRTPFFALAVGAYGLRRLEVVGTEWHARKTW